MKDANRLRKLWKLIGKGVLNFFGSRFFDRRKDKLIFDDNNQKTQWEKDFKLLAPENWTNGELKNFAGFFKNVNPGPGFPVRIDITVRPCQTRTPKVRTALPHLCPVDRQRMAFFENPDRIRTADRHLSEFFEESGQKWDNDKTWTVRPYEVWSQLSWTLVMKMG